MLNSFGPKSKELDLLLRFRNPIGAPRFRACGLPRGHVVSSPRGKRTRLDRQQERHQSALYPLLHHRGSCVRTILRDGVTVPRKKNARAAPLPVADALLMDIPEVARRLNTTVWAVRSLIRSGQLRYVQIGHKMLLSSKAIADFIVATERFYGKKSGES